MFITFISLSKELYPLLIILTLLHLNRSFTESIYFNSSFDYEKKAKSHTRSTFFYTRSKNMYTRFFHFILVFSCTYSFFVLYTGFFFFYTRSTFFYTRSKKMHTRFFIVILVFFCTYSFVTFYTRFLFSILVFWLYYEIGPYEMENCTYIYLL